MAAMAARALERTRHQGRLRDRRTLESAPPREPVHVQENSMRLRYTLALGALLAALGACTATEPGPPVLPGSINVPPPPMTAAGDALLTDTVWSWQETQMKDGARIVPEASGSYTLEFRPGGMVAIRADCNRGSGSYLLNGGALSFGAIALTRSACAPGSRDAEFLNELGAVWGQLFRGNDLVLTLKADSGSMRFTTPRQ
jgi:heat shock protein HslJ